MKRIKQLIFVFLVVFAGIVNVKAANFTIKSSNSNPTIGSTITVTVGVTGASGWEYCVSYDQSMFKLVEATSDTGGACVKAGSTLTGFASVNYKFQVLKSGAGSFTVSGQMYNDDVQPIDSPSAATQVTVKSAEDASKQINDNTPANNNSNASSNANLRVLEVVGYSLNPAFSKDKTNYTLEVGEEVSCVQVNAYREDTTAMITPIDIVNLVEGENKVVVTVTAAKGNKKTYTIIITRGAATPVKVTVDGKEYSVVTGESSLEIPAGFEATTVTIEEKEVKAYKNDKAGITLVVLKDDEGNMNYYMYKDREFTLYNLINSKNVSILPVKTENTIKGYEKDKVITIDGKEVTVYYNSDNEDLVLIYGMNTATGEKAWYYYDINEGTMLKYVDMRNDSEEEVKVVDNSDKDYKLLTLIFAGVSGLALLLIIILIICISRLRKKNEDLFNYMETRIKKHRDKKFNDIGDKDIEKSELATFDEDEIEEIEEENEEDEEVEEEIEEEIEEQEDEDEDEKVVNIDETILFREDDIIDLDEDDFDEEPKRKGKEATIISDTDILNNIARANEKSFKEEEPKKNLSKKEQKMLKKKEKALTKKAQREFLNDETFEESAFDLYERDETEVIPVVHRKKARRKKKK